ncbi:MAG: amidohydrolase [Verrucomicrobiota bacterium]|nr:amidohydrolase [Verrucomicrobiota bacterium]
MLKHVKVKLQQAPSAYLRAIHLDAVNALPAVIRFGIEMVGAERMLYSSDHPWVNPPDHRQQHPQPEAPAEHEALVFSGNPRKLFNL